MVRSGGVYVGMCVDLCGALRRCFSMGVDMCGVYLCEWICVYFFIYCSPLDLCGALRISGSAGGSCGHSPVPGS